MRAVCERASKNCYAVLSRLKNDIERAVDPEPMACSPSARTLAASVVCNAAGTATYAAQMQCEVVRKMIRIHGR